MTSFKQTAKSVLDNTQPDLNAADPYRVLGISPTTTQAEIKRAYFTLIRQYPPETEPQSFKLIRAAFEKIKNTQTRVETDILLPQKPPVWDDFDYPLDLDMTFYADDALLVLKMLGDLGRTDFSDDFREIDL